VFLYIWKYTVATRYSVHINLLIRHVHMHYVY